MIFLVSNIFTFFSQPLKPRRGQQGQATQSNGWKDHWLHSHELTDVDTAELQHADGVFGDNKKGMPPFYILSEFQRAIRTTGTINAIIKPGEVAVLADNRQITRVSCHLQLAVADNIRSSLSRYNTIHAILNRQFHFNYIV